VAEVIGQIAPRPLLLISTGTDFGHAMVVHYAQLAGEPATMWQIPETSHGGGLAARPDEFRQRVVAFFDAGLAPPQAITGEP
jgi:hypothetical protein